MTTYKHDCNCCKNLGTTSIDDINFDLYFCNSEPTVIARFGDEPQDYMSSLYAVKTMYSIDHKDGESMLDFLSRNDSPLAVAAKEAILQKHLDENLSPIGEAKQKAKP